MSFLPRRGSREPGRRRSIRMSVAGLAALLALVALVAGAPLRSAVAPEGNDGVARALGPLPACRYDDILTSPRGYDHWAITLVDTILRVPRSYEPPDLVPVSEAGVAGGGKLRAVLIDDLREMADDARAADAGFKVVSTYRSYETQVDTFDYWVSQLGREQALKVSARPGHSEHQLGLGVDFGSEDGGDELEVDWGETAAGRWVAMHAWKYGFLMSYPKGQKSVTCYSYEPWHFRYVGRELAADIHASGLTIREYLWANYTTAVVPPPSGQPLPTLAPTRSPATPGPTLTPEPSPTAVPSPSVPTGPTPSPSPQPTVQPSPAPTAGPTPPPDPSPIAGMPPEVAAGAVVGLLALAGLAALVLRRGRSGAVL